MSDLMTLLNKELLTKKDLVKLKKNNEIDFIECCGKSGEYNNYTLYNVVLNNGKECSVYI